MKDFAESIKGMIILELSERLKLSNISIVFEKTEILITSCIKADYYYSDHWKYSIYPGFNGYLDVTGSVPYEDIDCVFLTYPKYLEYVNNN